LIRRETQIKRMLQSWLSHALGEMEPIHAENDYFSFPRSFNQGESIAAC